ncbi:hypothetical protein [Amaricoccus tamworthensis]
MGYVFKGFLFLVVASAAYLLAMAIFSDLPAPTAEISKPIDAM